MAIRVVENQHNQRKLFNPILKIQLFPLSMLILRQKSPQPVQPYLWSRTGYIKDTVCFIISYPELSLEGCWDALALPEFVVSEKKTEIQMDSLLLSAPPGWKT